MLSACEVEQRFLDTAGRSDGFMRTVAEGYHRMADEKFAGVRRFLFASANEYLLAVRRETIADYCTEMYGGPLNAPSDFEQVVNPTREKLMELNAICGYYGADRTIIHIYLDAHLTMVVSGICEPVLSLDSLIRDLKTATA